MQSNFFVNFVYVFVGPWDNASMWELRVKDCQNQLQLPKS